MRNLKRENGSIRTERNTTTNQRRCFYETYSFKTQSSAGGYANVTIDNGSEWVVTNDSTIGILTVKDSKNFENHVKDKDGKEIKIFDTYGNILRDGDSDIKITVADLQLQ